jgi:hypothetical protein
VFFREIRELFLLAWISVDWRIPFSFRFSMKSVS